MISNKKTVIFIKMTPLYECTSLPTVWKYFMGVLPLPTGVAILI